MKILYRNTGKLTLFLVVFTLLSACSTAPKLDDSKVVDNSDPFESTNRSIYSFNEGLDRHLLRPVASTYVDITPQPFRTGVTNFFNNVRYINVIVNSSLQGKIDQGFSDFFRFVFNSTLGIGGLFDVATPMGLEAHKEDLGQTFAVWGSSQGPYLTLPALGPNTVRDTPDLVSSYFLNPISYLAGVIAWPATFLYIVNTRANFLDASDFRDSAALDPYSFTREAYLQSRRRLIYDGNPPVDDFDDIFDQEFGDDPL
jgi:phospholipid-binding lipoprotein MlaA